MSPELEIFRRSPSGKAKSKHPIVFVHGAFTGAWCWNEHFLTWFADKGFETVSFSLRGPRLQVSFSLKPAFSVVCLVEGLGQRFRKFRESTHLVPLLRRTRTPHRASLRSKV